MLIERKGMNERVNEENGESGTENKKGNEWIVTEIEHSYYDFYVSIYISNENTQTHNLIVIFFDWTSSFLLSNCLYYT